MQHQKFNFNLKLNICFIGEEAEDGEGPRRIFRLILNALADSSVFHAPEGYCTPLRNAITRQRGHFRMAGSLMAMSLVQGGPAPAFLNHAVVQYLCGNKEDIVATIAQVANVNVRNKLTMVHFHAFSYVTASNDHTCIHTHTPHTHTHTHTHTTTTTTALALSCYK